MFALKSRVGGLLFFTSLYRVRSYHTIENGVLLFLLTLIWGSSYILIKKGLLYFSPAELAAVRISFSAIAVIPFAFRAWRNTSVEKWPWVVLIGLSGSGIPAFLFAFSVGKLGSSVNGILNAMSPLFTLLVGVLLFRQSAGIRQIGGVILGLAGAVLLQIKAQPGGWVMDWRYILLPVGATFCYGLSANITRFKLADMKPLYATTLAMLAIGIPCWFYLFFSGLGGQILSHQANYTGLCYVGLLSLLGTVVAWSLFYRLVQQSDALFAASVTYLIPGVALIWGYADGEMLTWSHWTGLLLILGGVYFVSRKE